MPTDAQFELDRKVAMGALWTQGAFLAARLIVFASTVVLARLLLPEDFGLLAIGLVVLSFLDTAADLGSGTAVVWRPSDPERTAAVALTVALISAAVVALLTFLSAPLIAAFFEEPRVTDVVRVLSIAFFLSAPASIFSNLLLRQFAYRRRIAPEMAKSIVKGGVAIGLALLGFGVWSLVFAHLAALLAALVILWSISSWRPRLSFDRTILKEILPYGIQIALIALLGVAIKNVDQVFVGYVFNAAALGIYVLGFTLIDQVVMSICWAASQALFPLFAIQQNDPAALRKSFVQSLRSVTAITFPAAAGIAIVAEPFVQLLYGERWLGAIPVMQALAVYALIYSAGFNLGDLYKATGRPHVLTLISVANLVVAIPVLAFFTRWGIAGVAVGQIVVATVITCLDWVMAWRLIGLGPRALYDGLKAPVVATALMVIVCIAVDRITPDVSAAARLSLLVAVGVATYAIALVRFAPDLVRAGIALAVPQPAGPREAR